MTDEGQGTAKRRPTPDQLAVREARAAEDAAIEAEFAKVADEITVLAGAGNDAAMHHARAAVRELSKVVEILRRPPSP